jgi:hypothetical protein
MFIGGSSGFNVRLKPVQSTVAGCSHWDIKSLSVPTICPVDTDHCDSADLAQEPEQVLF